MKEFLIIAITLVIIAITDITFEYGISRDLLPTPIIAINIVILIVLWVIYLRYIIRYINNFNKQYKHKK